MIKTYSELSRLKTFDERFKYLRTKKPVGESLFGYERYLNQLLYQSYIWKKVRRKVIIRDKGNDLGLEDYPINGFIVVHHINPITIEQIEQNDPCVFDLDNLISVSDFTHRAIHYMDECSFKDSNIYGLVERRPNDTCPWKGG